LRQFTSNIRAQIKVNSFMTGNVIIVKELIFRLIYTEAVLMEVQRICPVAPLAVPHVATQETQIMGFTIPKVRDDIAFQTEHTLIAVYREVSSKLTFIQCSMKSITGRIRMSFDLNGIYQLRGL
jgi:Cytochrome P450